MDKFRKELQRRYEAAKGVEKAIYGELSVKKHAFEL